MTLFESELEVSGYRCYKKPLLSTAERLWQKRIEDEMGTRYFINFYIYDTPAIPFPSWTMKVHNNSPHMVFELPNQPLFESEAMAERFFTSMGCDYYERNET